MSLNVLPGKEATSANICEMRYSPARDITHLLPAMIKAIGERMEDGAFKPMDQWLDAEGFTLDDRGQAVGAFCEFMVAGVKGSDKPMFQTLDDAGWNKVPWQLQLAVMYYVGAMMSASFYNGAKEVNEPDHPHVRFFVKDMIECGLAFERYTSRPWWKRWLIGKSRMLKRIIYRSEGVYREF
jgi:hypothetical protein